MLKVIVVVFSIVFSFISAEEIVLETNQKKLRFFNLDLHISVIADLKNIFESLGHEVVDWSISGHTWVFNRPRDVVEVVNENTWGNLNQEMCDQFYETYKDYLSEFDAFIVTHTPSFALLYEKFNKPIIIVNSTRYESPFSQSPNSWEWLNEYLIDGVRKKKIFIISNNKADSYYLKYYTGIESDVIPNLCLYTNCQYTGGKRGFYSHGLWGADIVFDENWSQFKSKNKRLFASLPLGYKWQDLYDLQGVIHFPYNISTMSLFEQYSANVPIFFPSKALLLKLHSQFPDTILSHLSFWRLPEYGNRPIAWDEPNQVHNPEVVKQWIGLADFYDTENMPYIQYFDSFEELQSLLTKTNCKVISEKMREYNIKRKEIIFQKWIDILKQIQKES